ncbi:unnamed protein product [Linum tenue]|uniref:Uncharacterized protein n=1 Tax=Linum tenue TaxID=586396 RepID=A0AAV0P061_9ROSI|nr:unnamed protein product [Linum tenue]
MAASSSRGGPFHGGAAPFRSRDGLSTRQAASSDEIQLRIDPMSADFDDEITGLRSQVRQLRNLVIDAASNPTLWHYRLIEQQMTLIKAQASVKNNIRKLNKSIIKNGSNHIVHVVLFALLCFFILYLWTKVSRR